MCVPSTNNGKPTSPRERTVVDRMLTTATKPRKLKRALTAYNLFTGLLRERIVNETDQLGLPFTEEDVRRISKQYKMKEKRKHRKSHGLITFRELSKLIAERWRALPQSQKDIFERQALREKLERDFRLEETKKHDLLDIPEASLHSQWNPSTPRATSPTRNGFKGSLENESIPGANGFESCIYPEQPELQNMSFVPCSYQSTNMRQCRQINQDSTPAAWNEQSDLFKGTTLYPNPSNTRSCLSQNEGDKFIHKRPSMMNLSSSEAEYIHHETKQDDKPIPFDNEDIMSVQTLDDFEVFLDPLLDNLLAA